RALLHAPELAPVDRLAGPQRLAQPDRLVHAADPLLERHAHCLELEPDRRHVGGDADAQDQPALGDAVDRRHLVRQQHGIAQGWQQHRGAELGLPRARGDGGQERQRIVARPRRHRIADPDRIVAQLLGRLGQRQQRAGLVMVLHDALARRQQVSELGHFVSSYSRGSLATSVVLSEAKDLMAFQRAYRWQSPWDPSLRMTEGRGARSYENAAKISSIALFWLPLADDGTRIGVCTPASRQAATPSRTWAAVPNRVLSLSHLSVRYFGTSSLRPSESAFSIAVISST